MTSRCSISSLGYNNNFEVRNYISSLNNITIVGNNIKLGDYKNFINKKESKPVLALKLEHERYAKQGLQINDNSFIINNINIIKTKISNSFNAIKYNKPIIKTDMQTNIKTEIISKNIERETITEITNEIKNTIIFKDRHYSEKYHIDIDDHIIYISEIKENNYNFGIICGNNNIYAISHIKKTLTVIPINIKIYLILQIKEKEYVISCDKGTYYYVGSIFEINSENLKEEAKISKIPFKNGKILDNRYAILVDNDLYKQEGNFYIYDSNDKITKKNNNNLIINKYLYVKETLSVINIEENGKTKTIILCACKGKENENGILLIKKESDNIKEIFEYFSPIKDFIIKFICPLKDFNIRNDKPFDTKYIIVVGENDQKMEMRLYEIKGLETNSYPTVEIADYLFCKDNISFDEMSFIIQSKENGNLIIGYHNGYTRELCFCLENE